jgi:hypothetical protein
VIAVQPDTPLSGFPGYVAMVHGPTTTGVDVAVGSSADAVPPDPPSELRPISTMADTAMATITLTSNKRFI